MRLHFSRSVAAFTGSLAGAALIAGCGGSGVGNSATARIRVVDASPNAGTANILINSASAYGDMQYFTTPGNAKQAASPYLYIGPQNNVPFSYTATSGASSAGTNTYNVSQDQYYSAFLVGRGDIAAPAVTTPPTPADPRTLQVVLLAPRTSPSSGLATLRVLNAAPDAGFTAAVPPAAATVGSLNVAVGAPATNFNSVAYATASPYQTVTPGGSVAVSVTLPGGAAVTSGPISLSANTVYTLVVAEKAIPVGAAPPTYELQLLSE